MRNDKPGPSPDESQGGEAVGGLNAVLAALKNRPRSCRSLLVAEGRRPSTALDEIYALAREANLAVRRSPRKALDRLFGGDNHQGVVALFDAAGYTAFEDFLESLPQSGQALVLALDKVEDPGNLGALMRSAAAFGAAGVLVPRERAAPLTRAAVKASAGAAEVLPLVRAVNLRRALEILKKMDFWLVGAEGDGGQSLSSFTFPDRAVLVLGSEGRGLSPVIKKECDFLVAIDQRRDQVSSLNVSVAGGILMAEYYRKAIFEQP